MADNSKQDTVNEPNARWKALTQELNHVILSIIGLPNDPKVGLAWCCRALVDILASLKLTAPAMYRTLCEQTDLMAMAIKTGSAKYKDVISGLKPHIKSKK